MCEPATLMAAAAVTSVATGGVNAYMQYQQGNFADDLSKVNQRVMNENARQVEQAGALEADRIRQQGRKVAASQAAALAANNLDISSGTPLDLLLDTVGDSELDAQTTRYNAAVDAGEMRFQGRTIRRQGRFDKRTSRFGAGATILGSAGQAAGQYGMAKYYR